MSPAPRIFEVAGLDTGSALLSTAGIASVAAVTWAFQAEPRRS